MPQTPCTHRRPQPSRLPVVYVLMSWLTFAIPAQADQGHDHLVLSEQQETTLLNQLVANSPHRLTLQAAKAKVGNLPPGETVGTSSPTGWNQAPGSVKAWPRKKGPRNYGFLPYWTMKTTKLRWDKLTQISWFSAEVNSDGTIDDTHGWGGATAKALIAEAHKHDVQVTLTFTLFSKTGISNAIATSSKRNKLIDKIVSLVIAGGGDGCNIDFEGLAKASRDQMKAFTAELTKTMHSKLPGSDVTLATPPVDWTGAWDYDYLAENSDGLFVMAYGVHYTGSHPGPQLPLANEPPWTHKTMQWIVDDYMKWGKAANKHKFIIGLPLYGNSWSSSSDKTGAKKLAKGKAKTYEQAQKEAPTKGGWKWDAASKSSYYVYKISNGWQQTWVDNIKAFKLRTAYLEQRGVQLGLWALGYADKNDEVWKEIGSFMGLDTPGSNGGADGGSSGSADAGSNGGADGGSSGGADAGSNGGADAGSTNTDAGANSSNPDASAGQADDTYADDTYADAGGNAGNSADAMAADTSAKMDVATADDAGQLGGGTDTTTQSPSDGLGANGTGDTGLAAVTKTAPKQDGGCQAIAPMNGQMPFIVLFLMTLMTLISRRNFPD